MKKWQTIALGGAAAVVAAVMIFAIQKAGFACANINKRAAMKIGEANGCIEFWLNRYQTSFQTALSFLVGAIGLYFILRQLKALSEDNEMTRASLAASTAAQEEASRIALGRAIGAIDAYTFAVLIMIQHVERAKQTGTSDEDRRNRKRLIENAEARRPDVYAALVNGPLRQQWREFERDFDSISIFLAENEAGGVVSDPTVLRLSKRSPNPTDLDEASRRAGGLAIRLMNIRDELER